MLQHKPNTWIAKRRVNQNGRLFHQEIKQKVSRQGISGNHDSENVENEEEDAFPFVKVIDWSEALLSNSKGFSRLVRHCDDKSLNILSNPKLFQEKDENPNIVVGCTSFVELSKMKRIKRQEEQPQRVQMMEKKNVGGLYNFEGKAISETRKSSMGFPDSLFLTQIYNEEKYDSIDDPKYEKSQQIFSSRGMCTTSLCTKK